ncbi:MAG: hypothetical protein K9M55_04745 [Candidatus Marinimicrobia bacterium]|nr:hypothetical protein [Candidatus Neomarinimicrobiota bacterium]MCF7921990.1 hypothetical protein [Candidatus Neomarinimicrobiota bacterium]
MHKIVLMFLSVFIFQAGLYSKDTTDELYLSPGVSLGYTFGDGFTWGGQISIGAFQFKAGDGFIWGNVEGPVVGLTAGFRRSNLRTLRYVDAQVFSWESPIPFGGLGLGKAWVIPRDTGEVQGYVHIKAWAWYFGAIQADRFFNKTRSFNSLSGGLLLPLPFTGL